MSKISKHFGLTLPGPSDFSSFRVDITFTDIDTEGDVEAQLEACKITSEKIDTYAEEALVKQALDIAGVGVAGFGLSEAVAKLTKTQEKIIQELKRQKEILTTKSE